jgi:hypothetical protein
MKMAKDSESNPSNHTYNFENSTYESFLYTIDKTCNPKNDTLNIWTKEMLVIIFNAQLSKCLTICMNNPKIDFEYFVQTFKTFPTNDLPWDSLFEQLKKKTSRNIMEEKIYSALKIRLKK